MLRQWIRTIGGLCFVVTVLVAPTFAAVERVILISIDGIRNSEGFGDPDCQPGYSGQVPGDDICLLSNLKTLVPEGTLYTSEPGTEGSAFLNNAAPWTTPGHTMLLTGVRDVEPNIAKLFDLRSYRPTLFERLRKTLGWAQDQVVAVVSKDNVKQLDYSGDPAHGPGTGAHFYSTPPKDRKEVWWEDPQPGLDYEDVEVAIGGRCLMNGFEPLIQTINGKDVIVGCDQPVAKPSLLFLHFGGVDHEGHENPEDGQYEAAIQQVDAQIFTKIWGEIGSGNQNCSSPSDKGFCRDNTVLIITTDHGRESFTVQRHGGLDWADRAIFLLAVGPGIPAEQVVTNRLTSGGGVGCEKRGGGVLIPCRQQEDLAPTIAVLFGVEMPDAEGVVMDELLGQAGFFPLQRSEPRVGASQGKLHVVWSERDPDTGDRVIQYQRLDPTGQTRFDPIPVAGLPVTTLSAATDAEGRRLTASQPYLFANGVRLLVVFSVTRGVQEAGDNRADIYLVQSVDGGTTWGTPERVAQSQVEGPVWPLFPTAYFAPATVLEVSRADLTIRRWVFTSRLPVRVVGFYKDQPGLVWHEVPITSGSSTCETLDALAEPLAECASSIMPAYFAQRPDATVEGQQVELGWQAVGGDRRWDVFRAENTSFDFPDQWAIFQASPGGDTATAYLPGVSLQGNTLNVLWVEDREAGPVWKVYGSRTTGAISGAQAFLPDVVAQNANTVYAVYSQLRPDPLDPDRLQYDIVWNRSITGGTSWEMERRLTVSSDPSLYPSLTYDQQNQKLWVVWREGNGPDWVIKGQQITE